MIILCTVGISIVFTGVLNIIIYFWRKQWTLTESQFIKQNKEKWMELESMLAKKVRDPDKLYQLFEKVSGDLSFAQTFYPNRSVRLYLNQLTQRVFDLVGIKKLQVHFRDLIQLFSYLIPLEVVRSWPSFISSVVLFITSLFIGVITSAHNPQFARTILGDTYINMTEENINAGDPMAVYKDMEQTEMFLAITINNIRVAFLAFVLGLLGGIGTVFLLISNGIMVGAFQYFFYSKGLFLTSFLTIWIHGTIEISCIIIAGAAGLVLGKGLLFPGTYDRLTSLQLAAGRAWKILLGTIPLFIIAGFLEGFVTRQTDWPASIKAAIILVSFLFILYMWVFLPWKQKKLLYQSDESHHNILSISAPLTGLQYRSFEQNLTLVFSSIRNFFGYYLKFVIIPFAVLAALVFWYRLNSLQVERLMDTEDKIKLLHYADGGMLSFIMLWIFLAYAFLVIGRFTHQHTWSLDRYTVRFAGLPVSIITFIIVSIVYFLPTPFGILIILFSGAHFWVLVNKHIITDQINWQNIRQTLKISYNYYHHFINPLLITLVFWGMLSILFNSGLSSILVSFISWHDIFSQRSLNEAFYLALINSIILFLILPVYYLMISTTYESTYCKSAAVDLEARLKYFGQPQSQME